ncbi:restriction endonuclease subunit S [Polaromonas sp.]|uniref:restriction endonuclease subunit S n=1 Tax=Polaromonas sp. TaxID=1869339 RepID=UPI00248A7451|nr:restriction endonuclease subunit S [Polaromonas sp.]MDI1339879.1 restriction endonuclease subunit S [Polaromonas sp.]
MNVDWQSRSFEECIDPISYAAKVQRKDFLSEGAYPVVSQEEAFINGFWDQEGDLFRVERPVVVFGDHTRALKYIDFDFVLGADGVKVLKPKQFLYPRFFYYQLHTAKLDSLGYARHYRLLRKHLVAYPGYEEQQRIVAILDEAFDGIATAKANAEKNLQNARALFDSNLHAVFARLGEGWSQTTLGEICAFENGDRGKNYPNRKEYVDAGIPWINTGHIRPDGTLSDTEMNFLSKEKFDSLRSGKIRPGDLVYCLRGATLGKTALVDPLTMGAVASSLVIIRPGKLVNGRFLFYFLTSPVGRHSIKAYENGAAQPNLGAKNVAKYVINLPGVGEQEAIVNNLDAIADETQRLESIYQQKLAALDELKKSLLHQAFSGAL